MKPTGTDPREWDLYIEDAATFVQAQDRMGEALGAGVDFEAVLRVQGARERQEASA